MDGMQLIRKMRTLESILDVTPLDDEKFLRNRLKSICKEMGRDVVWANGILRLGDRLSDVLSTIEKNADLILPYTRYARLGSMVDLHDMSIEGGKNFPSLVKNSPHKSLEISSGYAVKLKDITFEVRENYMKIAGESIDFENVNIKSDVYVHLYYVKPTEVDLSGLHGYMEALNLNLHTRKYDEIIYKYILNPDDTPRADIDKIDFAKIFGVKDLTFDRLNLMRYGIDRGVTLISLGKPTPPTQIIIPNHHSYYTTQRWGIQVGRAR